MADEAELVPAAPTKVVLAMLNVMFFLSPEGKIEVKCENWAQNNDILRECVKTLDQLKAQLLEASSPILRPRVGGLFGAGN